LPLKEIIVSPLSPHLFSGTSYSKMFLHIVKNSMEGDNDSPPLLPLKEIIVSPLSPYLFPGTSYLKMFLHIVKNSMGKVLTRKIWRKQHALFKDLHFYPDIT
jgi:hypothetical protein